MWWQVALELALNNTGITMGFCNTPNQQKERREIRRDLSEKRRFRQRNTLRVYVPPDDAHVSPTDFLFRLVDVCYPL